MLKPEKFVRPVFAVWENGPFQGLTEYIWDGTAEVSKIIHSNDGSSKLEITVKAVYNDGYKLNWNNRTERTIACNPPQTR